MSFLALIRDYGWPTATAILNASDSCPQCGGPWTPPRKCLGISNPAHEGMWYQKKNAMVPSSGVPNNICSTGGKSTLVLPPPHPPRPLGAERPIRTIAADHSPRLPAHHTMHPLAGPPQRRKQTMLNNIPLLSLSPMIIPPPNICRTVRSQE
ncbi:hypothetical protein BDZ89DRAFT_1048845 [Hymenopellis radicata]|nr:hypothetical protein BDZ89DRAFT_1048845 [Hymenopellis radicata]